MSKKKSYKMNRIVMKRKIRYQRIKNKHLMRKKMR